MMDGLVIRWKGITGWRNSPEISASRNGVCISGCWPILDSNGIESVKAQLDQACAKHQELQILRRR